MNPPRRRPSEAARNPVSNSSGFLALAAGPAPLVRVAKVHNGERRRGTAVAGRPRVTHAARPIGPPDRAGGRGQAAKVPDVDGTLPASRGVVWRRACPLAQSTSNAPVRRLVASACAMDASWRRAHRRTLEGVPG